MAGDQLEIRGPVGGWFVWRTDRADPFSCRRRIRHRAAHGHDPRTGASGSDDAVPAAVFRA